MSKSIGFSRLSNAKLVGFSSIGLPLGAVVIAVSVYLPPYLAATLGLSMTAIGASWATVRLIDLFVDPVLGLLMDRTQTSLGRYRPWIMLGAPILMAALWALFQAKPGIGTGYLISWLLVLYLGQSILTMGQSAWAANLAPDYDGRSRAFGAIGIANVLGMLALLLVPVLATSVGIPAKDVVHAMGWFIVGLTPCVVALAALRTPEPLHPASTAGLRFADVWALVTKPDLVRLFLAQLTLTLGPGWMTALYIFFFTMALGFSTGQASLLLLLNIVAGVFGAWAFSRLSMRFGKHRALMGAAAGFALGLLAVPLTPKGSFAFAAPINLWLGFATAGFDVTIRSMLADVGDEIRLERGRDQLSLVYAVNAVANKLGWALSIGLAFPLLSAVGFNPIVGATNSPAAIRGLELIFLAGPVFFVVVGGLCVLGWRLDAKRHAEVRRRLFESDADAMAVDLPAATLSSATGARSG